MAGKEKLVNGLSDSGSETDDEGLASGLKEDAGRSGADADASEYANAEHGPDNERHSKRLITRKKRNEGFRTSITESPIRPNTSSDYVADEKIASVDTETSPRPFLEKSHIQVDVTDAAEWAAQVGCSRYCSMTIRKAKITLPELLAADADFLNNYSIGEDDQERLLKASRIANLQEWRHSSLGVLPTDESYAYPVKVDDLSGMLHNSTFHVACIEAAMIDSVRSIRKCQTENPDFLALHGYQDKENIAQLQLDVANFRTKTVHLGNRLDELSYVLKNHGENSTIAKYASYLPFTGFLCAAMVGTVSGYLLFRSLSKRSH